ncbi:MAG: hypothetical protein ACKVRP_03400 [Bacteroidota bacterium]
MPSTSLTSSLLVASLILVLACSSGSDDDIAPGVGHSLEGFLDIHWGEPGDSVMAKMLRREGVILDSIKYSRRDSTARTMFFHGGTFLGQNVSEWSVGVASDGFYRASTFFTAEMYPDLGERFVAMRSRLENRFGPGKTKQDEEKLKINGGMVRWRFPISDSSNNRIILTHLRQRYVRVGFTNGERERVTAWVPAVAQSHSDRPYNYMSGRKKK